MVPYILSYISQQDDEDNPENISYLTNCNWFLNLHFSLPANGSWFIKFVFCSPRKGTIVPKHVGDLTLTCLLIKTVHFFGVINGVL
jgi:hypothetical protein